MNNGSENLYERLFKDAVKIKEFRNRDGKPVLCLNMSKSYDFIWDDKVIQKVIDDWNVADNYKLKYYRLKTENNKQQEIFCTTIIKVTDKDLVKGFYRPSGRFLLQQYENSVTGEIINRTGYTEEQTQRFQNDTGIPWEYIATPSMEIC
jgi:hypothetical protein